VLYFKGINKKKDLGRGLNLTVGEHQQIQQQQQQQKGNNKTNNIL